MSLPRDYYSLSELKAIKTIWGNDLDHAIETGKLIASVVLGRCENASTLISEHASVPGYGSRPFYLDRDTAARIIQSNNYPLSYLFESLDEVDRSENDPEFLATYCITSKARITAGIHALVITTEAWERFAQEHSADLATTNMLVLPFPIDSIINSELKPPPEPPISAENQQVDSADLLGGYRTPDLIALIAAVHEFWLNHNPDRPPKQEDIVEWLMEKHGMTKNKAEGIDRIIRPVSRRGGGNRPLPPNNLP